MQDALDAKQFEVIDYSSGTAVRSVIDVEPYREARADLEAAGATRWGGMRVLADNTAELGPLFVARGTLGRSRFVFLAPAYVHEIEAPWRRGPGLAVGFRGWSRAVGFWWRGSAPRVAEFVPEEERSDVSPGDLL
jgi:hypothetical protein